MPSFVTELDAPRHIGARGDNDAHHLIGLAGAARFSGPGNRHEMPASSLMTSPARANLDASDL